MKNALTLMGIIFIILGSLVIGYHGFTYTKQEQVAQLGSLKVTADTEKRVDFPPVLGGIAIAAGVILILVGRRNGGSK